MQEKPMTRRNRFTLIGLVIVAAILGICIPLLVTALAHAREAANRASCKGNLCHIRTGMELYVSSYGKNAFYPPHLQDDFLNCLRGQCGDSHPEPWAQRAPLPQHDDLFVCPSTGTLAGPGVLDYGGPLPGDGVTTALNNDVKSDRIILGDRAASNHGEGGNFVRFDGSVGFNSLDEYNSISTFQHR
jgi:prepilin-type processing-associated H-X9-DG protein